MIYINGIAFEKDEIKLSEYLSENNLAVTRIAVELNGEILPKDKYDKTVLSDGDRVEIVNFVGGG